MKLQLSSRVGRIVEVRAALEMGGFWMRGRHLIAFDGAALLPLELW